MPRAHGKHERCEDGALPHYRSSTMTAFALPDFSVRRLTPDFIASDEDSDFGGATRKRRKAEGSSRPKVPATSNVNWVPEFRRNRRVKYRSFVPDMETATAMAARAKEDAIEGRLPPMHDLNEIFADIVKRCDTTAIVELAKTLQVSRDAIGARAPPMHRLTPIRLPISPGSPPARSYDVQWHRVTASRSQPHVARCQGPARHRYRDPPCLLLRDRALQAGIHRTQLRSAYLVPRRLRAGRRSGPHRLWCSCRRARKCRSAGGWN